MVGLAPKLKRDGLPGPWNESRASELLEQEGNRVVWRSVWRFSASFRMILEPSFDLLLSEKE